MADDNSSWDPSDAYGNDTSSSSSSVASSPIPSGDGGIGGINPKYSDAYAGGVSDLLNSGYTDNGDGTFTQKDSQGNVNTIKVNSDGTYTQVSSTAGTGANENGGKGANAGGGGGTATSGNPLLDSFAKAFGLSSGNGSLASFISGNAGALTGLAALAALASGNKTTTAGYKGSIPKLTATRQQINPAALPGQSRQYFTDTQYTPQDSGSVAAAQQAAAQQAAQLQAAQQAQAQQRPQVPAMAMPWAQKAATGGIMGYAGGGDTDKDRYPTHEEAVAAFNAAYPTPKYNQPEERGPIAQAAHDLMVQFHLLPDSTPGTISPESQRASVYGTSQIGHAAGGVMGYADGGSAQTPRYLQGTTDGMADQIPTSIDGKDPALLSHGEFVVPADVVSHLGNGNSDAGAEQLYKMMDKVRMARTGTKRQGKRINPDKFTPGGIAGYAEGGTVKHFATGDSVSSPSAGTSTSSTLSPWAGDYVTQMLGRAQALGDQSMPVYQGELAAGPSDLQNQQAAGLSQLYQTGLQPTQFTNQYQAPGAYNQGQYNMQSVYGPQLQNYQMQQPQSINGVQAQAAQMSNAPTVNAAGFNQPSNVNAQQVNAPNIRDLSMQAAQNVSGPSLQNYQMGPASQVGTQDFTSAGTAAQFMNPYLQQSLDPQIALLQQQQGISHLNNLKAQTQAGAFGGSRADVQNALENQADQMAMSNLIGQGYNTAYGQAQQQFNAQQQANLQAQQANQQAGLTVGQQNLGANMQTQNLGATLGQQAALANQANQQQANLQNLSAGLQTQGLSAQTGLQAQQLNQASNLQAGLANQTMGYNTGLQNAQLQQQANLANQSMAGQYGLQQGQFGQAANMNTAANQQAANLANQQMAYNTGNTNLQALLGVQSLGSGQNMQGQLANQSTNLATQQAQQAANQFAYQQQMQNAANRAQYGLAAQQGQSAANQASANFGLSTLGAMGTAGATQQQIQQAQDTAAYNQFQQQAQYPYQQLQFQQSMLQGLPISTYANTTNTNPLSQITGTVSGLGGLYNSFSKASGG